MQSCHKQCALLIKKLTVVPRDGKVFSNHLLGGNAAQAHHNFGAQQPELHAQPREAGGGFFRGRVAVFWRAALNNIGNINIFAAVKVNRFQVMVQQLAAAAHKRQALCVLVGAGAFAHKKNLGVRHTLPKHHMGAGLTQSAALARQALLFQLIKIHE